MKDRIDDYDDHVVLGWVAAAGVLVVTPCAGAAIALIDIHYTMAAIGVGVLAAALVLACVAVGNRAQQRRMKQYQAYLEAQAVDALTLASESPTLSITAKKLVREVLNRIPSSVS